MNLIPKIAEMLGVELEEEFKIKPLDGVYMLDESGLLNKHDDGKWYSSMSLTPLLTGQYKIEKLPPFEPMYGDKYWHVLWYDGTYNKCIEPFRLMWDNSKNCWQDKYCGNCFRTEEEAQSEKYSIYKKLTGREWEDRDEDSVCGASVPG